MIMLRASSMIAWGESPRVRAPTRERVKQWTIAERLDPSHLVEAMVREWWEKQQTSSKEPNDYP
jgi:hypothetical protein